LPPRCAGRAGALRREVAQKVFVELARHAARLGGHPALLGWI